MAAWLPPEIVQTTVSLLAGMAPAVQSLLQGAPSLAGGLGAASWVVWGLGSGLLLLLGAGLHFVIGMARRRGGGSGPQSRPPLAS